MTTIFRGMRPKKFFIRSSISGGGKSRNSMAEAANIASNKIYDWNKKEWISIGESEPVLFISTELTKEEIQDCLLAHISGVEQDRIEIWDAYNITQIGIVKSNFNIDDGEFENGIHDCVVVNNKYLFSINHALDGDYIIYWKLDDLSIDSCTKSSVSIKRIVAEIENNKIICENDEYELLIFDKEARQVVTVLKNWKCKNGDYEIAISPDGIKYVIEDSNYIRVFL